MSVFRGPRPVRGLAGLSLTVLAAGVALPALPTDVASAATGGRAAVVKPAVSFPLAGQQRSGSILRGAHGLPTSGPVTVMLELDATSPTLALAQRGLKAGSREGVDAVREARARVEAVTTQVRERLTAEPTAATPLFTLHNVYSGIAVRTDASRLSALAALPGVKAVHAMPQKSLLNSSTVPLVGAPTAWGTGSGAGSDIGTGATIGIIDTGIDYTHADFGGTGTTAAYTADHAVDDARTLTVPSGDFPSAKVAGGYDFVGDGYDSAGSTAQATPHPDPNPLDCDGHGTHVAGTAAGLGVTASGGTYTGPWSTATPFSSLKIGPGVAPGAKLYALRVFGCSGDTDAVSAALDWAADPNGDGNFSDHLDVVNMSLGTDYSTPDDPDALAADALSLLGTTVVAAAGNGGDLQDVAGSPANGDQVISVAASQDAQSVYDALHVTAPASAAGDVPGQESSAYPWATSAPVTAPVVSLDPSFDASNRASWTAAAMDATNADGCDPFTAAQKAAVAGKIVWLEWTDKDALRRCGSAARGADAASAGAVGVILTDDENTFAAGILGVAGIPVFQIRATDAARLRPALTAGLTVTLTHALHGSQKVEDPTLTDVVSSFSSRGLGDPGLLKPDLTAPGSTVFSAGVGSGNGGLSDSGTSMATPHVAGAAALVVAAHPTWKPAQVKAALVDTATHDVWSDTGRTVREAPDRVGTGRLDAAAAVTTPVLAYATADPAAVGVSFGAPSYTKNTKVTRTVTLLNTTSTPVTYSVSFDWANKGTHPSGVGYGLPKTVTVPAGGRATVPVTLQVRVTALRRTVDAAHAVVSQGIMAPSVTEASGWLTLIPVGAGQKLRVSVYAAPRPASAMKATSSLAFGAGSKASLKLAGHGVLQGSGTGEYQSLVSGYELQLTSPRKPACTHAVTNGLHCTLIRSDQAGDLKAVGVASDVLVQKHKADRLTYFAVGSYGAWRTAQGYVEFDVYIDTDGDGKADAVLYNDRITGTDEFVSALVSVKTGDVVGHSVLPIDAADGAVDTNVFNSDVMVLPVLTSALTGMSKKAASGQITYWVAAGTLESGLTDKTGKASFNVLKPGLTVTHGKAVRGAAAAEFGHEQFFADLPGSTLTVQRASTYAAQKAKGLLLVHQNNVAGARLQVVPVVTAPTAVHVAVAYNTRLHRVGTTVTVTAHVVSKVKGLGVPRGPVRFYVDGKAVAAVALGPSGVATFSSRDFTRGSHVVGVRYVGRSGAWATSATTVKVSIA